MESSLNKFLPIQLIESNKNSKELIIIAGLCMLLVSTLIVSDILTYKVAGFFNVIFTIPALLYPLTYAIGDTLTEAYGRKVTFVLLGMAIGIEVIFDLFISFIANVPNVFDFKYYEAFNYSLGKMYIAALGVIVGSILGFVANTTIMFFLKNKFSYRSFPIRSVFSSLSGELVFTITAFSIWFYSNPNIDSHNVCKLIISSSLLKIFFAFLYAFPAFWIARYLVNKMSDLVPLKIMNVLQINDKPGSSIFEFQIAGKRVVFSEKSKRVTLNMFCALNESDQQLIEADLRGNLFFQLEKWIKEKHENSSYSRWNKWDWSWNSSKAFIQ